MRWLDGIINSMDMLLLPLSRFSHVRLCATPQTAAHQAPLSLGFSKQEHCCHFLLQCVKVKSLSRVRLLATPQPTRLLPPWDFPGKSTGVGCHCLLCNGHDFEQALGDKEEQEGLACCSLGGHKELNMTERLNNRENMRLRVCSPLLFCFQISTSSCPRLKGRGLQAKRQRDELNRSS